MFSCKFATYLQNSCFDEHLRGTASANFYSTCLPYFSIQIRVLFSILLTALRIRPGFCLRLLNSTEFDFADPAYRLGGYKNFQFQVTTEKKTTRCHVMRSWRPLHFMIQGNNTIGKHFMKPMPYCYDAMCWSSILKLSQTLEDAIKLIIKMFLQLRKSKIVYHL